MTDEEKKLANEAADTAKPVTPKQEKEIAKAEAKTVATIDAAYFKDNLNVGTEEVTQDDIPTPTLSLVQSNSKMRDEAGKPLIPGKFYYKGTGEVLDEVECAFLVLTKKDLPSFSNKEELEHTHIWLGALLPTMDPFLMYMRGYGLSGTTGSRFAIGRQKSFRRPMYSLKLNITSQEITNDKGTFYVPVIKVSENNDTEQIVLLEQLAKEYAPKLAGKVSSIDENGEPLPWEGKKKESEDVNE